MYPSSATKRKKYTRPLSKVDAISYEKVDMNSDKELRQITLPMPPALKVQPESSFRLFSEPDVIENAKSNIICSGTALLITEGSDAGTSKMVGILRHDAAPDDVGVCIIEGLFLMQADPTLSQDASTLNGLTAYYDVDDGLVYSGAGATSNTRLEIGYFDGGISELELQPNKISGYHYASVRLDPSVMRTNTAVSQPSDASSLTDTATPYVRASISALGGLDQAITISATSPDPRYQSGDLSLTVSVEGTEVYNGSFKNTVEATFTAGSGKAVILTVTDSAGNSGTATYTGTFHATNAPASWARS